MSGTIQILGTIKLRGLLHFWGLLNLAVHFRLFFPSCRSMLPELFFAGTITGTIDFSFGTINLFVTFSNKNNTKSGSGPEGTIKFWGLLNLFGDY